MNPKLRIRHYEAAIAEYEQMLIAYREAVEHLQRTEADKAHLAAFQARKHRQEAEREIARAEQTDTVPLAARLADEDEKQTKAAFGKLTIFTVAVIGAVLVAIFAGTTGDLSKTWKTDSAADF
ncbi:MAG: hypothetical protein EBY76_09100, partial [Betaproteobacteria bacterium]|nr:hypothetical protein [Betaproteobacteria bacterium]